MGPRRHYRYLFLGCIATFFAASVSYADLTTASTAPLYTAASVVQAASQTAGALAPNTLATIYGTNLSWTTHALTAADLTSGTLPTSLDGVTVYMGNILCSLFFVSPGQINFLIPYEIVAQNVSLYIVRQGVAGPVVNLRFAVGAPGFFQWNGSFALAQHADGRLITASAPAQPGEVIVLYATGLGRTSPDLSSGHVASGAINILYLSQLQVLLDGVPRPASSIYYAGVTPGFAGLYQINLMLPSAMNANPAIQVTMGSQSSPASVFLYAQ
ncbi:MAG: hypothetical protein M3N93_03430 [Acidobacteriota bacterium]|nr:hypothetical protein [Acidobacteriota bacterium]